MWPGLTRCASQLSDIQLLLREQNSLLRELIAALTSRSAQTPRTGATLLPSPVRPRTPDDVTVSNRAVLARAQAAERMRAQALWREPQPGQGTIPPPPVVPAVTATPSPAAAPDDAG